MNEQELLSSYNKRFEEIYKKNFLSEDEISSSQYFFEKDSLTNKQPIPRKLDVYCVVSGLPFENEFIKHIKKIQYKISRILKNTNYYFVKPSNLAVEYIVLKWPNDHLHENILEDTIIQIKKIREHKFKLKSFGFQFHSDGAIILRCVDESQKIQGIRSEFITNIKNLPEKQSSWSHVPLGRILGSVDKEMFKELLNYSEFTQLKYREDTLIKKILLIHEYRWYQSSRKTLLSHFLT